VNERRIRTADHADFTDREWLTILLQIRAIREIRGSIPFSDWRRTQREHNDTYEIRRVRIFADCAKLQRLFHGQLLDLIRVSFRGSLNGSVEIVDHQRRASFATGISGNAG